MTATADWVVKLCDLVLNHVCVFDRVIQVELLVFDY